MRQRMHLGDRNVVGARIRRILERQEMEQTDVITKVELMGKRLTQSKLSRIEGQQSSVTDRDLMLLAEALDVPIAEFFRRRIQTKRQNQAKRMSCKRRIERLTLTAFSF